MKIKMKKILEFLKKQRSSCRDPKDELIFNWLGKNSFE